MVNITLLRKTIKQKGSTPRELANKIGIDTSTLYRRFDNNGVDFTIGEAEAIADALDLTNEEFDDIFFANEVA